MSLTLLQPRTARVEKVGLSGRSTTGLVVIDHDGVRDASNHEVSLLYRVLDAHPSCRDLKGGAVYMVTNPYGFTRVRFEGEDVFVMHETNFLAEIEGYDDECRLIEQEEDDMPDAFGVCARA